MNEFLLIMPEIILTLALSFMIVGEITYFGEQFRLIVLIALLGLGGAFLETLVLYGFEATQIFGGVLSIDGFSLFFKMYLLALAAFSIVTVSHSREISPTKQTEYCVLVVSSTLAACLVVSVTDLALAFLSCLMLLLISSFLAAFGKRSVRSTEAALKALAFGAVSLVLFLYAAAILFYSTHSLNIYNVHRAIVATPLAANTLVLSVSFMILSMTYYLGAFPSYFLTPDLLEGAPTPVSAFLSIAPRAAGFGLMIRFLIGMFAQPGLVDGQWKVLGDFDWTQIVSVLSVISMAAGALMALRQRSAKRLVGYLVVSDTGFLLIGLLVLDQVGIVALLYDLVVGLFSLLGVYYILSFFVGEYHSDQLERLKGVLKGSVLESICLVIFLLTFVGVPPTPGFIGKFALVGAAIRHERYFLAGVAIFSMVLGVVAVVRFSYYLIGNYCQVGEALSLGKENRTFRQGLLASLLIPIVLAGVFADLVFKLAGQSLNFIFW